MLHFTYSLFKRFSFLLNVTDNAGVVILFFHMIFLALALKQLNRIPTILIDFHVHVIKASFLVKNVTLLNQRAERREVPVGHLNVFNFKRWINHVLLYRTGRFNSLLIFLSLFQTYVILTWICKKWGIHRLANLTLRGFWGWMFIIFVLILLCPVIDLRFSLNFNQLTWVSFRKWFMRENEFRWVFPALVEPVHIELSDKTVHVIMPEVFGEYDFFKLLNVLYGESFLVLGPVNDGFELFILQLGDKVLKEFGKSF